MTRPTTIQPHRRPAARALAGALLVAALATACGVPMETEEAARLAREGAASTAAEAPADDAAPAASSGDAAHGKELFVTCAACHGPDAKGLPNLGKPGKNAQDTMGTWPTYRVSQSQMRTMQHRLWDCYRQMRMPIPDYASDGITALTVYLTKHAEGGELLVPSIKR